MDLLSNVTLNDKLSTVLKSVTNQDDVFEQNTILQIEKNNHNKSPTLKISTMPSNISSDIYYDQKSPTTNENKLNIIPNILNKSNNSNELDNLEPTLFIPSKVTDTSSNINNITCLEKYNGSRMYEYKDKESDIRSIDGTKRKILE